ncbi:Ig-like domain-containing protein, partial [Pantoea trifolii]|uniref:Ig-like domain-containing protein n=1 Tax=Candidatus Pantoea symbiotica TaxID=1884370 RepID=UPI0024130C8C
ARPLLNGSAEAGSLVRIYDGNTLIGSAQVNAEGIWSWQYSGSERFSDAQYTLTVTATDAAGNVSVPSDSFVITVDSAIAQPTIATVSDAVAGGAFGDIASDGTGLTNDARPLLSGNAEASSVVTIYNGTTAIGSVVANATTGAWSWQYPTGERFDDGRHGLTVIAVDRAGNVSASSGEFIITVDTVPPEVPSIIDGTDNAGAISETIYQNRVTDDATPEFHGTAGPNEWVYIYDNDQLIGTVQASASGEWTLTLPELNPGRHNLSAVSIDAAGNASVPSGTYPFQLGTVWDFNDGTLDGWTLVGKHALPESNELVKTADGGYQLEFNTPGNTGYGGNVMTLEFEVEAGKTYDFSFILSRITHYALISPAQLALTVNGVPVSEYLTVGETPQKVAGSWTATSSGTITLAIHDRVDTGNGNDFWIDNIAIAPGEIAPPIAPISAPLPDEAVVDESIPLLANSYGDDRGASTFAVPVDAILQQSEDDLFLSGENVFLTAGDQAEDKITLADILPQGADIYEWAQVGERTLNEGTSPSYEHRSAAVDIDLQQSPDGH